MLTTPPGDDDPAWSTGVGDPTSYRHATLDLSAYANQTLQIRFRLESDTNLEYDGWYLDNVHINDATCTPLVSVLPPGTPTVLRLMPPFPNPSRGTTQFAFDLPRREDRVEFKVFDTQGRQLRTESLGALPPGNHVWEWNGRDGGGRETSAGVYFVRLQVGSRTVTQKAFRLPR